MSTQPASHPSVADGMFVGSELGTSFHCKCGWVSDRYETPGRAQNAAVAHVVRAKYPPTRGNPAT